MALSQTEQKYINKALADSFEEALQYQRLAMTQTKTPRTRAVYKALAESSATRYNILVRTIGHLGSSDVAKIKEMLYPQKLRNFTEEDIEELVLKTYSINKAELEAHRQEIQLEQKQAAIISETFPKAAKVALKQLADLGLLNKLIDTEKLINLPGSASNFPIAERDNLPRGNPAKAGIVSQATRKGMTYTKAHAQADKRLEREAMNRFFAEPKTEPESNDFVDARDLNKPFTEITVEEALAMVEKANETQTNKFKELMETVDTGLEPESKFKDNSAAILGIKLDDSDFDDPNLI